MIRNGDWRISIKICIRNVKILVRLIINGNWKISTKHESNPRKFFQKPAGRGELPGLSVALEECLEALSILPDNQAAKPKRHR